MFGPHGLGPIRQLGYVVRDLDDAMRSWAERLRVGPWFVNRQVRLAPASGDGRSANGPTISYALANSGDMQIELIEQLCATPSVYLDHLARHGEGLHHLCVWPEDYDRAHDLALSSGLIPALEGRFGRIRFAYFHDAAHGGTALEITELGPERLPVIDFIRDAAAGWDGTDPIRPYPRRAAPGRQEA